MLHSVSRALVPIPAGSLTLSDRRTSRQWEVCVAGFEIGVHQVTRQEYAAALDEGLPPVGRRPAADGQLPATDVSWWDAAEHCNRLSAREGLSPAYAITIRGDAEPDVAWDRGSDGYRLPTEAEWEHACRAGTAGPRYGDLDAIAWFRDNSGEGPHAVGRKTPNAFGVHDTIGNVWEWCWDHYDPEVYGSYRVLRGGGWFDEHWSCRASVRRRSHPTLHLDDVGFRLARGPAL